MERPAAPLPPQDFERLMAAQPPAPPGAPVAVACSGGADSMALALLLRDWCAARGHALLALVVDHRIRAGSGDEAETVRQRLESLGVAARGLRRPDGPIPRRNVQAAARDARYRLLLSACAAAGVADLFLAHHQDDQAETVLLRLARGSGVDGLAAMRPVTVRAGVRLRRPLLSVPKARLVETLRAANVPWIEDPSNHNPDFSRTRIRALLPQLALAGITPARLVGTAERMARAGAVLRAAADAALAEAARDGEAARRWGGLCLSIPALAVVDEETGLRALSTVVRRLGGGLYPPRLKGVARLWADVRAGRRAGGRTLGGCRFVFRPGVMWAGREADATDSVHQIHARGAALWDNRFLMRFAQEAVGARVAPMGADGWRRWVVAGGARPDAVPAFILHTAPGLWRDGCAPRPLPAGMPSDGLGVADVRFVALDDPDARAAPDLAGP